MSGENNLNSKSFLRPPISGHGFDQNSTLLTRPTETNFLLRPSALTATAEKLRTDKTDSSNLKNPFSSVKESTSDSDEKNNKTDAENDQPIVNLLSKSSQESSSTESNGNSKLSSKKLNVPTTANSSGYVFGKNISSRVVNADSSPDSLNEVKEFKDVKSDDNKTESDDEKFSKSLVESAQEIQERNPKPEFEEIELITGEENEVTIVNLSVKTFVFDKEKSNWLERGRGYVRVNDVKPSVDSSASPPKSRVIMRVQGSLKLIINTFVWSGMVIQKANEKNVRMSAQTDEGVKMFLLVFHSVNDASHFFSAVSGRKQRLGDCQGSPPSKASAPKRSLPSNTNSDDKSSAPASAKKSRSGTCDSSQSSSSSTADCHSSNSENDSSVS